MDYLPGVDVVVVNYHSPLDLIDFVEAFRPIQYEVPASLHVVNVEATEEDVTACDMLLDGIEIPSSVSMWPSNVGYANACNRAALMVAEAKMARSTVAFFNADTRLLPGVLDACHWELHAHKDWGVIGPRQVDDTNRITHGGVFGTLARPTFDGRWHKFDEGQYNEIRDDCVSVSGSAYFVKRKAWDALTSCKIYREIAPESAGAFLPTRHYFEETWLSYHAITHGWKVVYHGGVSMIHKWHGASPVGGFAEKEMPKSRAMFRAACDRHSIPHE